MITFSIHLHHPFQLLNKLFLCRVNQIRWRGNKRKTEVGVKGGPEGCLFKRNRCGGAADAALLFYFSHAALWLKDSKSPSNFRMTNFIMPNEWEVRRRTFPLTSDCGGGQCVAALMAQDHRRNKTLLEGDVYLGDVCCFFPLPSLFLSFPSSLQVFTMSNDFCFFCCKGHYSFPSHLFVTFFKASFDPFFVDLT